MGNIDQAIINFIKATEWNTPEMSLLDIYMPLYKLLIFNNNLGKLSGLAIRESFKDCNFDNKIFIKIYGEKRSNIFI